MAGFMNFRPKKGLKGQKMRSLNPLDPGTNLYLQMANQCKKWQIAFIATFILLVLSCIAYFNLSKEVRIKPYVVEVNKEAGEIKTIGVIDNIKYTIDDKLIYSVLSDHVINTRTISLDIVFCYKTIKRQYNFVDKVAGLKLNEIIAREEIDKKIQQQQSRDIKITSLLKLSDNNYQVRWLERSYTKGSLEAVEKMAGIFTVKILVSATEEAKIINPLGITITDFNFAPEIAGQGEK